MSSLKAPYQYQFFDRNTGLNDAVFNVQQCTRVKQVHSNTCIVVNEPFDDGVWVEADAMVTDKPDLPIGVITADCAPVLLKGKRADGKIVIGAAHAGWQGALGGVLDNTVQKMACDVDTIEAFIGPCISKSSYEVSKGFEKPFVEHNPKAILFFTEKNADKLLFDLKGYCAWRLRLSGVQSIQVSDVDTLTNPQYHSHRGGANGTERNLSAIMISG